MHASGVPIHPQAAHPLVIEDPVNVMNNGMTQGSQLSCPDTDTPLSSTCACLLFVYLLQWLRIRTMRQQYKELSSMLMKSSRMLSPDTAVVSAVLWLIPVDPVEEAF
jgi:hypothetical protein